MSLQLEISFVGSTAGSGMVEFYDLAHALVGFERSLALTVHAVLNNEVITKAPALSGAELYAQPPDAGSWKLVVGVLGAVWLGGQSSRDSAVGHALASAYDYVISESLGVHVDFDSTVGSQLDDMRKHKGAPGAVSQQTLDSAVEKCERAIREMHRPIVYSESASKAKIRAKVGDEPFRPLSTKLTYETYQHISYTEERPEVLDLAGFVSRYDSDSFKGRIFTPEENRPVPFELAPNARRYSEINLVTSSLRANALARSRGEGNVRIKARKLVGPTGITKGYIVIAVTEAQGV
jgi:hypothetical protein